MCADKHRSVTPFGLLYIYRFGDLHVPSIVTALHSRTNGVTCIHRMQNRSDELTEVLSLRAAPDTETTLAESKLNELNEYEVGETNRRLSQDS